MNKNRKTKNDESWKEIEEISEKNEKKLKNITKIEERKLYLPLLHDMYIFFI